MKCRGQEEIEEVQGKVMDGVTRSMISKDFTEDDEDLWRSQISLGRRISTIS